jgi:diguanylate cyclase (GGDEF)-like protein
VSFRRRLTLFFLLIVVVPMIAVAVLVTQVSSESRNGKADARLAAGLQTALSLYRNELADSQRAARDAARDPRLADALRSGDSGGIQGAADQVARSLDVAALAVRDREGREVARAGTKEAVAEANLRVRGPQGRLATLTASTVSARAYARQVARLTGREAAILRGEAFASTVGSLGDADLPEGSGSGEVKLDSGKYRVATTSLPGEQRLRLALFGPLETGIAATRPLVAGVLAVFFALAVFFVVMLLRALQGQVKEMLGAARRIGGGDFSQEVPVEGRDELAGLAREFNKMSGRLGDQMDELRRQRVELEQSVQRIGEAFAAGLDREALLGIVAETALAACGAESCRVAFSGPERAEVGAGSTPSAAMQKALGAAQSEALREGRVAEAERESTFAIAQPLIATQDGGRSVAAMSIARAGRPFDEGEREMLRYLAGQASVSVENVDLHELVSEQAVTDELTGLSNNRRFRELIDKEAERARRFGHDLSLVVLDIDDFKQVNDTHGHLQGDEVLRMVAQVLRDQARGVDEPARYGGEEFVIALPETALRGALEVAERVRTRVEQTPVSLIEGEGTVRVTASLGVASLADRDGDVRGLFAAADEALYRAKREGKNRTEGATAPTQ